MVFSEENVAYFRCLKDTGVVNQSQLFFTLKSHVHGIYLSKSTESNNEEINNFNQFSHG